MFNRFLPDTFIDTVFDIDLEKMKSEGISAFIFDIDNTLATYAMPVPDEKTAVWLKELIKKGFKVYFVSNNKVKRAEIFAKAVGIPYIGRAFKPIKFHLKRACIKMNVLPENTALVGDQLFTDIWGGNRMGMYTILVTPISKSEDKFVSFKRRFEERILKKAKIKNGVDEK